VSVALQTRPDPLAPGLERAEFDGRERLSELLRRCRGRLNPQLRSLDTFSRLPIRIGKAITQEEIAEAVGISRQWYAMLEGDRSGRVSAAVLARIADVLMLDPAERAALFRLAVPELRLSSLTPRSTTVLDAFQSLRRLTLRLWAASTEAEALAMVREHAMAALAPDAIVTCTRLQNGCWGDEATGEDEGCASRFHALIRQRWGDGAIDGLHCYTPTAEPGEVMTHCECDRRCPGLSAKVRAVRTNVSFATANVRSQRGFFARLSVVHFGSHEYSEIERAQLSGLADLASLALSGCTAHPCVSSVVS
jgi:transcriptional regulator with XRE-family HTH domain